MSTRSFGADSRIFRPASRLWPPATGTASPLSARMLIGVLRGCRPDVAEIPGLHGSVRSTAFPAIHLVFEIDHRRPVVVPG